MAKPVDKYSPDARYIPVSKRLGEGPYKRSGAKHDYKPSLPWGVENPEARSRDEEIPEQDGSTMPWWDAPSTSHVHSAKYIDVRKFPFLKRNVVRAPGRELLGDVSILYIRYRDDKTQGIKIEYQYAFDSAEQGEAIFEEMKASPHPYSQTVVPRIIKAGIKYSQV